MNILKVDSVTIHTHKGMLVFLRQILNIYFLINWCLKKSKDQETHTGENLQCTQVG